MDWFPCGKSTRSTVYCPRRDVTSGSLAGSLPPAFTMISRVQPVSDTPAMSTQIVQIHFLFMSISSPARRRQRAERLIEQSLHRLPRASVRLGVISEARNLVCIGLRVSETVDGVAVDVHLPVHVVL